MKLCELTLVITNHAYEQYCARVEQINRDELHRNIQKQIQDQQMLKGEFLKLEGVWWVYVVSGKEIQFVTCYGKSNFDMPQALQWAKRHGDRIRLG